MVALPCSAKVFPAPPAPRRAWLCNSGGAADYGFSLGQSGDLAIAGDWNGDGRDAVGVFRPSTGMFYLSNSNDQGFADIAFSYGISTDKPTAGDWNNDGIDTIGVFRSGTFYLRNSNSTGFADLAFVFGGLPGDLPVAGNCDGQPATLPTTPLRFGYATQAHRHAFPHAGCAASHLR